MKKLNQAQIAKELGVSKAYISMVMSGKKKPSARVTQELTRLGVNFEANSSILSHARLPIPTLPRQEISQYNSILRDLPQTIASKKSM